MKAIILAAGRGSRLGNYTKELPKALVDINGKSLIERQIHLFQKNNITQIIIVRGYMKEKFNLDNIQFIDDDDYTNHDQLGSLMAAQEKISGEVLISFADLVFDENILQQILDVNEDILFMSRSSIPSNTRSRVGTRLKQVAIMPFRKKFLLEFQEMESMPLEIAESIELLRALEHGFKIRTANSSAFATVSVDTEADRKEAEKQMKNDNNLR